MLHWRSIIREYQSPVIDLHCHMLPGIDDGAPDMDTALRMAEMAVADGISLTVCTPHIYPGFFENTVEGIRAAESAFREALEAAGIPLALSYGADIQVVPEMVSGLQSGSLPTLGGSRYFLFEPPHHTRIPRLADLSHACLLEGYVPVITHPERLAYIESDYDTILQMARAGAWVQITGGSLLGMFGSGARHFAERFLSDGVVHLLASDGHNLERRAPVLAEARAAAALLVGEEESWRLVQGRPESVIRNDEVGDVPLPPGLIAGAPAADSRGWFSRLFRR